MGIVIISGVAHSFRHRKVSVVKPYVFAHKTDMHGIRSVLNTLNKFSPVTEVGLFGFKP